MYYEVFNDFLCVRGIKLIEMLKCKNYYGFISWGKCIVTISYYSVFYGSAKIVRIIIFYWALSLESIISKITFIFCTILISVNPSTLHFPILNLSIIIIPINKIYLSFAYYFTILPNPTKSCILLIIFKFTLTVLSSHFEMATK